MTKTYDWISRRNPTIEASIVFETAYEIDYRFRHVGSAGIGVMKTMGKSEFENWYRLKKVPA